MWIYALKIWRQIVHDDTCRVWFACRLSKALKQSGLRFSWGALRSGEQWRMMMISKTVSARMKKGIIWATVRWLCFRHYFVLIHRMRWNGRACSHCILKVNNSSKRSHSGRLQRTAVSMRWPKRKGAQPRERSKSAKWFAMGGEGRGWCLMSNRTMDTKFDNWQFWAKNAKNWKVKLSFIILFLILGPGWRLAFWWEMQRIKEF